MKPNLVLIKYATKPDFYMIKKSGLHHDSQLTFFVFSSLVLIDFCRWLYS